MQEDVSHYASPSTGRALTMAQRKKGRRAYLDSFHQTPSGDYIYTGATYSLANGSGRTAVRLAVLGAAAVAAEEAAAAAMRAASRRKNPKIPIFTPTKA